MAKRSDGVLDWSVEDIDKIVHEPARFRILSVLYVVDSGDFQFLMAQTGLTKGNLSSHMTKLEEAGYIRVKKDFVGRKPHTMLGITKKGRRAFESYRELMCKVIGN
ncbi:MAG: winged helix-turn-helix domain-containing protein [Thermoplasmatota archaeon]